MKAIRPNAIGQEWDQNEREREDIQNEKEELHEIFEQVITKKKNNKKGINSNTYEPVNLHELVRKFKYENQVLTSLEKEFATSSDLRSVSKRVDCDDFENLTNRDFNKAF